MAQNTTVYDGDLIVSGTVSSGSFVIPENAVGNPEFNSNADVNAAKLLHHNAIDHEFVDPTSDSPFPLYVFDQDATILYVEIQVGTPPTGDKVLSIDIQKGNSTTAFATILASPMEVDVGDAVGVYCIGSVVDEDMESGDVLRVTMSQTGSTGNDFANCLVQVSFEEYP